MSQPKNFIYFQGNFPELVQTIKEYRTLVVMVLTSEGCIVCRRAKQVLPTIINENPDIVFIEVMYAQKTKDIFMEYGVTNVPQFFFIKGLDSNEKPKQAGHLIGFDSKELRMKINQYC